MLNQFLNMITGNVLSAVENMNINLKNVRKMKDVMHVMIVKPVQIA